MTIIYKNYLHLYSLYSNFSYLQIFLRKEVSKPLAYIIHAYRKFYRLLFVLEAFNYIIFPGINIEISVNSIGIIIIIFGAGYNYIAHLKSRLFQ